MHEFSHVVIIDMLQVPVLRERAYSSMNYQDYCKQGFTPRLRPLEAPTVPPPILLNSHEEQTVDGDQLVVRLLKEHAAKQERELQRLRQELQDARMQLEELTLQYADSQGERKSSVSLLEEAMLSRSRSSSFVEPV